MKLQTLRTKKYPHLLELHLTKSRVTTLCVAVEVEQQGWIVTLEPTMVCRCMWLRDSYFPYVCIACLYVYTNPVPAASRHVPSNTAICPRVLYTPRTV